jgi:hypothetical protein
MHLGRAFATAVRNSPRWARSVAVFPLIQTEPVNRNCLTSPQLVGAASDTASQAPADADVADVAKAIVNVVDRSFGKHPFRPRIDPAQDGAEIVNGVADRVRAELLRNMQLAYLLRPSSTKVPTQKAL